MKANIEISKESETTLTTIKKIGLINDINVSTKEKQINLAIEIAGKCVTFSDDETLINLTNLKKSF